MRDVGGRVSVGLLNICQFYFGRGQQYAAFGKRADSSSRVNFTETEMSQFWRILHHWLHRKLSKWQLSVQSVMKILSKWLHFRFSVEVSWPWGRYHYGELDHGRFGVVPSDNVLKSMRKANWLVDTTWYHVVSTNQSALPIDFIIVVRGTIRTRPVASFTQAPHRISTGGSLLFMRCVSLTLTGLISAWRRGEAPSEILAKPLSDCVTALCLRQCK